ncbi:MAG TPA: GNAT family N-acetyltransferase [Desulfitobacterium dehalogenans]|uniref:GNAT family N-acetyltransferase n=1 Tax=Desulfitobacterium dehalogenans TaxID=36854 RepID=A0A7C6Z299_9FIRM|nr:GNAT family N-acetyltransferase [Desulfitobacterium dehalogenans]
MISIKRTVPADLDLVLDLRYEMLMKVNKLDNHVFNEDFRHITKDYFVNGNQTTILAMDGMVPIGCATICYIHVMPTFSHPTGKRAHFMNVYTRDAYRRQGIAKKMMELLILEAKEKGVTHLSLDATEDGRQLYYKLGFSKTAEGMELSL